MHAALTVLAVAITVSMAATSLGVSAQHPPQYVIDKAYGLDADAPTAPFNGTHGELGVPFIDTDGALVVEATASHYTWPSGESYASMPCDAIPRSAQ